MTSKKRNNLSYYGWMAMWALVSLTCVILVNVYVAGLLERFLAILACSFAVFTAQKVTRKVYDREAFSSKRSALHAIVMILIRGIIFATGACVLVTVFLGNGDEFIMLVDGITWVNVNFVARYAIVYLVIYGLAYMTTSLVLVNV